jgi:hypothetical protein
MCEYFWYYTVLPEEEARVVDPKEDSVTSRFSELGFKAEPKRTAVPAGKACISGQDSIFDYGEDREMLDLLLTVVMRAAVSEPEPKNVQDTALVRRTRYLPRSLHLPKDI